MRAQTKQYLPKATNKSEEMFYNFLSGVVGGTVATTCNTPLDVVTSRMVRHRRGDEADGSNTLRTTMPALNPLPFPSLPFPSLRRCPPCPTTPTHPPSDHVLLVGSPPQRNVLPGEPVKYRWGIPSLFMIAREEGWRALYKGYLPKLLRLGPGGGILLVTFEFVSNWLR